MRRRSALRLSQTLGIFKTMLTMTETAYVLLADPPQGRRYFAGPTALVREAQHARRFLDVAAAEEARDSAARLARNAPWCVAKLKIELVLEEAAPAA